MSYYSRLKKALEGATRLPLNYCSKYVIFSDCHRGTGNANDNFLKNRTLYQAALQYYYRTGFTYIELGDGDELWENRKIGQIEEAHGDIFDLICRFHRQKRLYMLWGNHDLVKKEYFCKHPPLPGLQLLEGLILEPALRASDTSPSEQPPYAASPSPHRLIFLTHGHQAEMLNSRFWRLARFLVRFVWKPLERFGLPDPTSAAKNYRRKAKTERRLARFARQEGLMLIAGHTHRPALDPKNLHYCNSGSCIHPYSITCLEISRLQISLIKWELQAAPDMTLRVTRNVLSGPVAI